MKELTEIQKRQIQFFRDMEATESVGYLRTYMATCYDCKKTIRCYAACTIIDFIYEHAGHKTWTTTLPKQDALTIEKEA